MLNTDDDDLSIVYLFALNVRNVKDGNEIANAKCVVVVTLNSIHVSAGGQRKGTMDEPMRLHTVNWRSKEGNQVMKSFCIYCF